MREQEIQTYAGWQVRRAMKFFADYYPLVTARLCNAHTTVPMSNYLACLVLAAISSKQTLQVWESNHPQIAPCFAPEDGGGFLYPLAQDMKNMVHDHSNPLDQLISIEQMSLELASQDAVAYRYVTEFLQRHPETGMVDISVLWLASLDKCPPVTRDAAGINPAYTELCWSRWRELQLQVAKPVAVTPIFNRRRLT